MGSFPSPPIVWGFQPFQGVSVVGQLKSHLSKIPFDSSFESLSPLPGRPTLPILAVSKYKYKCVIRQDQNKIEIPEQDPWEIGAGG